LDTDQLNQLINLCEFPASQKWELKYRASRDGFKSTDFHTKCNGIANTFTVIKTTSGNILVDSLKKLGIQIISGLEIQKQ